MNRKRNKTSDLLVEESLNLSVFSTGIAIADLRHDEKQILISSTSGDLS